MNVTKLHKCGNLEKPPHTAIVSMLVLPTWGIWAGVCWGVVLNVSKLCVNLPLRPFSLHCLFRLPPSPPSRQYLKTFSHKHQLTQKQLKEQYFGKQSINIAGMQILPTPHSGKHCRAKWQRWGTIQYASFCG